MTAAAPIGVDLLTHLPRLELRFSSSASLVAMDADDDPATLDWSCKAVLPVWEPMDDEEVAEGERLLSPDVSLSCSPRDDGEELTIFRMSGLTLELWRIHHIYDSLDSCSSDYEHFARLFDPSGDIGLHAEFQECLVGGTHVVLIDRARLAPAWRGLGGVGRLLIGRCSAGRQTRRRWWPLTQFPLTSRSTNATTRPDSRETHLRCRRHGNRWASSRSTTTCG